MIALPILVALLTLFDVTRSFEYFIDLERCKTGEMICFARQSCLNVSTPTDSKKLIAIKSENLNNDTCDVIVQFKPFTFLRYHMMIQVNVSASDSPSDELDTNIGVSIVQKETQIKCSASGVTGRIVLESYGTRQVYSKDLLFCSAILSYADTVISTSFLNPAYAREFPIVEFSISNKGKEEIKFVAPGTVFWTVSQVYCNDGLIDTSNDTKEEYLLFEIDKAPLILTCPAPQRIRVEVGQNKPVLIESLFCEFSQWSYMKDNDTISIPPDQPIEAHCAIAFNQLCPKFSSNTLTKCKDCTDPTLSDDNTTYTCPDDKWRMTDGRVELNHVKCKRRGDEEASGWFLDNGTEIIEGSCSTEFHCRTLSSLNIQTTCLDGDCKSVDFSSDDKEITCATGYNLTINGSYLEDNKFTCNTETGIYKSSNIELEIGSIVFCKKPPEIVPIHEQPQTSSVANIVGGSVGAVVCCVVIGGLVAFFVMKRRRHKHNMKLRYPDGLMTALEINTDNEKLQVKNGQYKLVELSPDEKKRIRDAAPYNVVPPVTQFNNEVLPRVNEFNYWKDDAFQMHIWKNFHRYSRENRMRCMQALMAFRHTSDNLPEEEKEKFGTIEQFIDLIQVSHANKLKCYDTWDTLFRLARVFATNLCQENKRFAPRRLRELFKTIATEMITDVGYKLTPYDTVHTMGIRLVAVRILLWLKDKKCTEEIMRMARLPLDKMESPLRQIAMAYAISDCAREQEIKSEFDKDTRKESVLGVTHGTYRQHLIYALCSARDTTGGNALMGGGYGTMREMLGKLHENTDNIFTPTDLLYAYKGALDDLDRASEAIDQFVLLAGRCWTKESDKKQALLVNASAGMDEDREKMHARFKADMVETCTRVAEACLSEEQFKGVQKAWEKMMAYAAPSKEVFDEEALAERAHNLPKFFLDEKDNEKNNKGKTAFEIWKVLRHHEYDLEEQDQPKGSAKSSTKSNQ